MHRGELDKPNPDSVAEHDQISEVYHVLSGTATLVPGPDIVNRQRRSATMRTVVEFNGPGNNGSEGRDGIAYEIKAGQPAPVLQRVNSIGPVARSLPPC